MMSGRWIVVRKNFGAKIDRGAFRYDKARQAHAGFDSREQRLRDACRTRGGIVRRATIMLGTDRRTRGRRNARRNNELLAGTVPHLDQRREQHQDLREHRH
ncbi:MAG: hypothetical protein ACREK8_03205 [Gemmatimonadales bacterium]